MVGQWPKVLGAAPLGTLPSFLVSEMEYWPKFNCEDWQSWDFHEDAKFPQRQQKPLNRTGPCFHPRFTSSLADLTESGGGRGPRWVLRRASF